MKFGSVCSGIEAASVAWEPLGFRAAWLSEIEPFPSAVLSHHYPNTPNLGDMTKIAERIKTGDVTAPEVLVGGTPCQAFSVAGLRGGLEDKRGALALEFVRLANAIDESRKSSGLEPAVIVWENVPGVLSSRDNAFGCFLAGLAGEDLPLESPGGKWSNAGYVFGPQRAIAWRTLDAQYFGLAQRRRRMFVVSSARNGFDPSAVLFEFEGLRRNSAPSRETRKGATGSAEHGFAASGDGYWRSGIGPLRARSQDSHENLTLHSEVAACLDASYAKLQGASGQDLNHGHSHLVAVFGGNNTRGPIDVATACRAKGGTGCGDFESETFAVQCVTGEVTHTLKAEGFDASEDGTGRGQPIIAFHGSQDPDVSGDVAHPVGRNQGQETCIAFQSSQSGVRLADMHATLDANNGARRHNGVISGLAVRRLTPVECERLQGFPDNHTLITYRNKPASDGPRYKAIGNSMAVSVMHWLGQRIKRALKPRLRVQAWEVAL